jgi:nucleotide-binding universal stress UspA family protein
MKRFLVPTDGSEPAARGVRYAVALAQQYKAMLVGIHVIDVKLLEGPFLRDISASLGTAPYVNYQGNIAMLLEERGKAALDSFVEACGEAGVPCEAEQVTGMVVRSIVERSQGADMIVMGRGGEHSEWLDGLVGSTTAAVVRRAQRPVLVTGTDTLRHRLFVIAFDGSSHARVALEKAASIAVEWEVPCHVLVVGDESARSLLEEAKSLLRGIRLSVDYVFRTGDPSEIIVDYARQSDADLLIMGAYGHTKVRELVVGSTTAYALNHAPCPLLLSR